MTKQHLKLVAKLYLATMAIQADSGYDPEDEGMTEKEDETMQLELTKWGAKLSKGHPTNFTSLREIVTYVEDLYYE